MYFKVPSSTPFNDNADLWLTPHNIKFRKVLCDKLTKHHLFHKNHEIHPKNCDSFSRSALLRASIFIDIGEDQALCVEYYEKKFSDETGFTKEDYEKTLDIIINKPCIILYGYIISRVRVNSISQLVSASLISKLHTLQDTLNVDLYIHACDVHEGKKFKCALGKYGEGDEFINPSIEEFNLLKMNNDIRRDRKSTRLNSSH